MSSPRPPAPIAGGHRQRASTSAANAAATPENLQAMEALRSLLDDVSKRLNPARPATDGASGGRSRSSSFPDGAAVAEGVRQVTAHLRASGGSSAPTPAQDDFRRLQGFERALEVLRSFSGFYDPGVRTRAEKEGLFGVLGAVLDLLDTAFAEHQGNRRYFRHRVGGGGSSSSDGGWVALEQSIASTGLGGSDADLTTNCRLFGKLLAFALGEPRIDELCQTVAAKLDPETEDDANEKEKDEKDEKDKDEKDDGNDEDGEPKADAKETRVVPPAKDVLASFQQQLQGVVTIRTRFRNVEIVRTAVGFWESLERRPDGVVNPASILVILILGRAIHVSASNLAAVHSTGVLSNFLRITFGDHSVLSGHERDMVATLCRNLMYLGVNKLADAQFLLRSRCPETSQFCLDMTATYNGPPFIQFDLSLHGHASIELPTLGRSFPPQSSNGYTFTAWIRVDRFDPSCHTTIFGVFDSTQTCFVLMYLERDTRNFILQTSVTSPRPSVRFKNFAFKDKQWYHIALVHRRPKTMTASKASLYVNGELVEQIKAAYPASPPLSDGSTESFASFTSSSNRTNPVQAFLGTPRDLSTQLGAGLVYSKWSFASAHLFEDVLSDDYLAVHYGIGPRYQGNFQDCLGSFQTYEASASLGLRNEFFHPGKDENSDILRAIRDKASTLVPEQRLLMSILPTAVFSADGSFMDTQLFRCLTRQAANNLVRLTYKTATTVVLNAALPSVNDAMLRASGVAVLTGSPVVGRLPYHFDDNLWRLAGFTPVALKLVERATSPEEVLRAVDMMFRCIRKSWRNSEAMERDNGYAILGLLLRAKLGYATPGAENVSVTRMVLTAEDRDRLAMQLLRLILDFVGYKHADPAESFIVNPMAYRILLIDFDTWRRSSPAAQELYYRQFVTFAEKSRYHQFNSRRLLRMRIIKRLLDALKAEPVLEDVVPYLVESLECLIKCNYSQEVHRSLALFITYTFHPTSGAGSSHPRTPKPQSATSRSTTPVPRATLNVGPPIGLGPPPKVLTRKQLGTRILELYANMLCEKGNVINIRKFARTVTNKVRQKLLYIRHAFQLAAVFL